MTILVTGGAGYIGSHLVKNLLKEGFSVVILDNLSTGFIEPLEILKKHFPDSHLEFIKCDLADKEKLIQIFQTRKIDAVIHLAAKTDVAESIEKPELYHQENFINGINVIEAMMAGGINKIIFSSTAAVYGNPKYTPLDENHPAEPLNPYGQTKLDFEKYLERVENLNYIIFRYFNVGGSDPAGLIGKSHITGQDLIENIMKVALNKKDSLQIFGDDYDTQDGTAIRDFIHIEDIVEAHILALSVIASGAKQSTLDLDRHALRARDDESNRIFNLGSEQGFSVKEIIDKARIIIEREIPTEILPRREGDIAVSVASAKKAKEILGCEPQYSDLDSIIRTDWNWRKRHPMGYTK